MSDPMKFTTSALDRALLAVAPKWALTRIRSRAIAATLARHYEAASTGRRSQNWPRRGSDANASLSSALAPLRAHSRDLVRNNGWARNAVRVITRNVVGWGITPKVPKQLAPTWRAWAGSTQCDAAGLLTFPGLEKLIMRGVVEGGEMLIRRRWRRPTDGLALPLQLQVLEPDFLDTSKTGPNIVQGIEFDAIGRRTAYWLFDTHPGGTLATAASRPVPASEVIHVFDVERAGQDRGAPWLSSAIVKLKEYDEFEDAQLVRQKVAACFAGFITDTDAPTAIGEADPANALVETLEPGLLQRLAPGQDVKFGNPPATTDDGFSVRTLRGIAAAVGVTYEDLVGDYSQVNFSSARMSRIAHWLNVYDWQFNMLIPQLCDRVWSWVVEAAVMAGLDGASQAPAFADWTPMPMPLTEPDREARANSLMVRNGQKTLSQVLREQGSDLETYIAERQAEQSALDAAGIWLDSDPRRTSQTGQMQASSGGADANGEPPDDGESATADEGDPAA